MLASSHFLRYASQVTSDRAIEYDLCQFRAHHKHGWLQFRVHISNDTCCANNFAWWYPSTLHKNKLYIVTCQKWAHGLEYDQQLFKVELGATWLGRESLNAFKKNCELFNSFIASLTMASLITTNFRKHQVRNCTLKAWLCLDRNKAPAWAVDGMIARAKRI